MLLDLENTASDHQKRLESKNVDYARDGSMTHNMEDEHTENILKNMDDANFIVKLKIDAQIIKQFDHEAHIPGDVSELVMQEDGSLIVTTKVNTVTDIDAEIKSWLPHIEILEPLEYRENFLLEIEAYRNKFI